MRSTLLIATLALGAAALNAGCVAHAQATGYSEADAPVTFSEEPSLVAVEPDVWVVRDSDYAVYYVDDYYWVYRGDVWHRSRSYDRGWATVEVNVVPRTIVTRDNRVYVHYHGVANAQVRKAPREQVAAGRVEDRPQHPDKDRAPGPPQHADDHHDGPGHDDHPGDQRHDEAQKDNVRHDDNARQEEPKKDDKKKADKKDKRRDDKK